MSHILPCWRLVCVYSNILFTGDILVVCYKQKQRCCQLHSPKLSQAKWNLEMMCWNSIPITLVRRKQLWSCTCVCAGAPGTLRVSSRHGTGQRFRRALVCAELLPLVLARKFVPLLYTEITWKTWNKIEKQQLSCFCLKVVVKRVSPRCRDGNKLHQKKS